MIVQVIVAGADRSVYVLVVSYPEAAAVESGGSRDGQLIAALVSPDPPSPKLTWRL